MNKSFAERFIGSLMGGAVFLGLLRREVVLTVDDIPNTAELTDYNSETREGRLEILDGAERVVLQGVARVNQTPQAQANVHQFDQYQRYNQQDRTAA